MARHPKGETFTSLRDHRSGELLIECRGCRERVEPNRWWAHKCPPKPDAEVTPRTLTP